MGVLYHDLLNILDYKISRLLDEYSIYKLVSIIIDENILQSRRRELSFFFTCKEIAVTI